MSALSAALFIFSFQFSLLFFHISIARQHQHCGVLLVLICNIGHRTLPTIWVGTFPVRRSTAQGSDFELILTVKMETRHPVGDHFGNEFPAICNYCGDMTNWSRKTWKFCKQFLRFLKMTPYGKISKLCSKCFTASPIDVVVFKCRKICPMQKK